MLLRFSIKVEAITPRTLRCISVTSSGRQSIKQLNTLQDDWQQLHLQFPSATSFYPFWFVPIIPAVLFLLGETNR
jgi:hypothetical protein